MIYRPVPIPEAKAASVDARLRAIILNDRTNKKVATLLNDPGFALAEGRREAIRKRIAMLKVKKAKLHSTLQKGTIEQKGPVSFENDVIDPES